MLHVVGLVETGLDLFVRQERRDALIGLEVVDQHAALIPGLHAVALDQAIAVLARGAGLGQR